MELTHSCCGMLERERLGLILLSPLAEPVSNLLLWIWHHAASGDGMNFDSIGFARGGDMAAAGL